MEPQGKVSLPVQSAFIKPAVSSDSLKHRDFLDGPFWQKIPAYREVDEATFLDHRWQMKNSLVSVEKLLGAVRELVPSSFYKDAEEGFRKAPMSIRISPYLLSLIDWENPYNDPIRRQFIPLHSQTQPDHPLVGLDSLAEQAHSPVSGLVHRYTSKALFLALDTCPVYCRFCTRSYAVGLDTEEVDKVGFRVNEDRWKQIFAYIRSRPELEDIVISGGDSFQLRSQQIRDIGDTLLDIKHIRRIRYATKGLAVMPQKILTDSEWTDALTYVAEKGRKLHKEVVIHTHFNHPREITKITQDAANLFMERGITIRNQCVLLRGVNDSPEVMRLLVKRLAHINIHPYYVFVHDLVRGVEDLRTSLQTAVDLEKLVRGSIAGFHTPTFVVDTPGGGGKRDAHSFDWYDRVTGVSVYTSPLLRPGEFFYYLDPIHSLPKEGQALWQDAANHRAILNSALTEATRNTHS